MKTERGVLLLSAVMALALGAIGIAAALWTGSQAILLDGLFNISYFLTGLFTLRVAALLKRPDDPRFPFGYGYFEPLINLVKGVLILGVCLFALVDAAVAIASGGREIVLGRAMAYAALATAICACVALIVGRARRRPGVGTPLLEADYENWRVNAAISAAVLLAFALAYLLNSAGLVTAARYVDPVLVGLVVLISIGVPVRMASKALTALVNRAPDRAIVDAIEADVRRVIEDVKSRDVYVRVVKPGRTTYAAVHVLLEEDQASLDVRRADALRRRMLDRLVKRHAPLVLDVVFTAAEEFAAPSAGVTATPQ